MNSTRNNIKVRKYTVFYVLLGLIVALIFVCCVMEKISVGGRWGTGIPLAMADRWLQEKGSLYPSVETGITAGSSYFPGVVFVALICRWFFGNNAEIAMIIFAGLILVLLIYSFVMVSFDEKKYQFIGSLIIIQGFYKEFKIARDYILEMHPDLFSLCFFILGIIVLNLYLERNKHKNIYLAMSTILFFLSGIFKQNAVFLYVGLGVFVLFTKELTLITKLKLLMSEFVAGVGVLAVVFSNQNCWLSTITVNSLHNLMTVEEFMSFWEKTYENNKVFVICTCIFLILIITNNFKLQNRLQKMWFSSAVAWALFGMYGAAKEGANEGNMEASIIVFMPFVVYMFLYYIKVMKDVFDKEKCMAKVSGIKNICALKWGIGVLALVIYISLVSSCVEQIKIYKTVYETRKYEQQKVAAWMNENYQGEKIAMTSHYYEVFNDADVDISTDFSTAYVFYMAELITDENLQEIREKEDWEVIITISAYGHQTWPKTFEGYRLLSPEESPTTLPICIYVKN